MAEAKGNSTAEGKGSGLSIAVANSEAKATGNNSVVAEANAKATSTKDGTAVALVKSTANSQHVDVRCKGVALDNVTLEHCPKVSANAGAAASANGEGTAASATAHASVSWAGAPACRSPPTQLTAVQVGVLQSLQAALHSLLIPVVDKVIIVLQDQEFRLWGYQDEAPCAYKTADQGAIYYTGYKRVTAEEAPNCEGKPGKDAKTDNNGRLW
jgi:hypothetical protein